MELAAIMADWRGAGEAAAGPDAGEDLGRGDGEEGDGGVADADGLDGVAFQFDEESGEEADGDADEVVEDAEESDDDAAGVAADRSCR